MATGVTVVKVGGNEVEDMAWVRALAAALVNARPLVVVHGGGREVSALQQRFGVEPEWRDGLRVSSAETVKVVSMVLSGVVNKRLVAALLDGGVDALGLSGEDGALITARPALDGALGRTGEVVSVRTSLLASLLALGVVPVVSPVSRGLDGAALNVNADDAAAAIASALGAERLLFVSNVDGVRADGTALRNLAASDVEDAIEAGVATDCHLGRLPRDAAAPLMGRWRAPFVKET